MNADGSDKARIDEIIKKYEGKDGILIQLLLDLQEEFSWLSRIASRRSLSG